MAYLFKSKVGTFAIRSDKEDPDKFELCIGGIWLNTYESAEHAAMDVHAHRSGWYEWDRLQEEAGPGPLCDWEML
jgi:hypothetical protein